MSYDPSGNLTRRSTKSGVLEMTYDGSDQSREASNDSTGKHEVYFYDPNGVRILTYRPADGSLPRPWSTASAPPRSPPGPTAPAPPRRTSSWAGTPSLA